MKPQDRFGSLRAGFSNPRAHSARNYTSHAYCPAKFVSKPAGRRSEKSTLAPTPDFQGATTDLSGHFRLRGLAPGEYQVIAVDEDIDEEITDPEFMSAHESEGLTIKVQEGERKMRKPLKLPPSSD